MSAFTTDQLQIMLRNLNGFISAQTREICALIKAELKERENGI